MKKLGVAYWRKDPKKTADKHESNHGISAMKFQLVKEFLVLGYGILLSDVDILVLKNPFNHLYRDEDVEALTDGFDEQTGGCPLSFFSNTTCLSRMLVCHPEAYGWDDVFDDPKMGWSRWAHSFHAFSLNSGLFYLVPNERTIDLMDRITDRLMKEEAWDQAVFNEIIWKPSYSHNGVNYSACKVSLRIMNIYDFVNSKTLFR